MTETQFLVGGFALILILTLALAAFLDNRWPKTTRRDFIDEHEPNFPLKSSDEDGASYLQTSYADLSACGLGTAEQLISFRGKTAQSPEGD